MKRSLGSIKSASMTTQFKEIQLKKLNLHK